MSVHAPLSDRVADAYLRSAVHEDGHALRMTDVLAWFAAERRRQRMVIERRPLDALDGWTFGGTPMGLRHRSGRFFQVRGVRVRTDFGPVAVWDQPILEQPEVGILGVITRVFGGVRHFLMQAKAEPGNVDPVQLAPTVQATRSNFARVHGGGTPAYLDFFRDVSRARVLIDQLQSEQGSRFLRKLNRNMIVEALDDVPEREGFCWMTLAQIKHLLRLPNVVNMDARTVLACLPLLGADPQPSPEDHGTRLLIGDLPLSHLARELLSSVLEHHRPKHSLTELLHWLTALKSTYELQLETQPLNQLHEWSFEAGELRHATGRYFSVIGVDVEAGSREVRRWQQPLLAHDGRGLNGFLLQRINGVLHFLVRACMYPGNRALFELGSTVSRSNADEYLGLPSAPRFLNLFHRPEPTWVRYDSEQSEEGGRFHHYRNRYMLLELPENYPIEPGEVHRWMTLGQMQQLLPHGYFNIEGRNLLACLDLCQERA